MTRNVKMEISLWELLLISKHHWKLILLVTILCAGFCGMIGVKKDIAIRKSYTNDSIASEEENNRYEENRALYDTSDLASEEAQIILRQTWLRMANIQKTHPIMDLDPYNCEWSYIAIRFENETGNHYGTVYNWVCSADEKKVFGDNYNTLKKVKNDLITVADYENETTITLLSVKGYDASKSVEYLMDYIKEQAGKSGINIVDISASKNTGYLYRVADFQKYTRDTINSAHAALVNLINVQNAFPALEQPRTITEESRFKNAIMYAVLGALLGGLAGAVIVMYIALRQGKVISERQMGDTFDLEQLGDCSKSQELGAEILNANLDVLTGEHSKIMLLGNKEIKNLNDFVSALNEKSDRIFIAGKSLIDDSATIDSLQNISGVIIAVWMGKTQLEDIQRQILRAKKLNKPVLGYIQV